MKKLSDNFEKAFKDSGPAEAVKTLNESLDETSAKMTVTSNTAELAGKNMEKAYGIAAASVGGLSVALSVASIAAEKGGFEDAAEGLETLANGAILASTALSVLPGILKAIGLASAANPITLIITGLIAVVTILLSI
jgi:hypothetical protein